MNITYSILLCILVLLIYISEKKNNVNKWCSVAGFFFSLGVIKEAFLFDLVPIIQKASWNPISSNIYAGIYSIMTWALYMFAMPTIVIFTLYFCKLDITNRKLLNISKIIAYIPSIILSFLFPPLLFREMQLHHTSFWLVNSAYNLILGVIFIVFMIRGVVIEKLNRLKKQKRLVSIIIMPPIIYWLITIFVIHPLGLSKWFKLWQGNLIIVSICIILYICMAFKDGIMGLKLVSQNYQWNNDMSIVNKGIEYTSHMIKNQTTKMEICINNLENKYSQNEDEEFAILSRSISNINKYIDKTKKHSGAIRLFEENCNLKYLIEQSSLLPIKSSNHNVSISVSIQDDICIFCDKIHMAEVFNNIIINSLDAITDCGTIDIMGAYNRHKLYYLITFTDNGMGMSKQEIKSMFVPYYTTKNTDKNFGLGLSYCLNVIEKHGGYIKCKSELNKGTTITIGIPSKKISQG